MKVSSDRINWTALGNWYDANRSVFAMNSEVTKFIDTQKTITKSGYKMISEKHTLESRVINVSGQIIGDDIEDCREKSRETRVLLLGESKYFLDEYYNMVAYGSVSNINDSISRGEYNGRVNLINFNISMADPFWQTLDRLSYDFDALDPIEIDYDTLGAVNTDYKLILTCNTASIPVTSIIPSLIVLSSPITLNSGDKLIFSSEGSSFTASSIIGGVTTNILGLVGDAFFSSGMVLTPGDNTIILNTSIDDYFSSNVSFYGRSI